MNISFTSTLDKESDYCIAAIDDQVILKNSSHLKENFAIKFECDLCTNEYRLNLTEVYVNTDGIYTNSFTIDSDNKYSQTFIQLTPIVMRHNHNYFGFSTGYTSDIMISPLTKT